MTQVPLRMGVIGIGRMGELHLKKFSALSDAKLSGIWDIDREKALKIGSRYGVRVLPSFASLLFEVDALCVATPTNTHYVIAKEALLAGVHVLVEKPITENTAEAAELVDLARRKNLVLQVGFVERFRWLALKGGIDITAPVAIKAIRVFSYEPRPNLTDIVTDLMIHDLDLITELMGPEFEAVRVSARAVKNHFFDEAFVELAYPCGCRAEFIASRVAAIAQRKIIVTTKNAVTTFDFLENSLTMSSPRLPEPFVKFLEPRFDALYEQAQFFISMAKGKQPHQPFYDRELMAIQVSDRILRQSVTITSRFGHRILGPSLNALRSQNPRLIDG